MTRYEYKGQFKQALLTDELIAALGVIPYVQGDGAAVRIDVEAEVTQAQVDAVIAAHDPLRPSMVELDAQRRETARQALSRIDQAGLQQILAQANDLITLRTGLLSLFEWVAGLSELTE